MRLSGHHIKFIEDYLLRNKVKFWDVRMELLDHIATDVQERMENGQTFEMALQAVHVAFGNKMKSKKLSKDQTKWVFTESIYADQSGYKKVIAHKKKEFALALRKRVQSEMIGFFKNPVTLLIYIGLLFAIFKWKEWLLGGNIWPIMAAIVIVGVLLVPMVLYAVHYKNGHHSIGLSSLALKPFMASGIYNVAISFPYAVFAANKGNFPFWYLVFSFCILFPLLFVEVKMYISQYYEYRKIYKKWRTLD